jgi:D-threonate/D-erythronate kinase
MVAPLDSSHQDGRNNGSCTTHHLAVIADDLTGACDAAIAFTGGADVVRVELGEDLPEQGIWAYNTRSRDVAAEEAIARLQCIASRMPAGHEVYKKIDSVFRGNTFCEIAAAVRLFPSELTIIAPAYPALGRTLLTGKLHLEEPHKKHHTLHVAQTLREHRCEVQELFADMPAEMLSHEMRRAMSNGRSVFLCDATEQTHLEAVVQAARSSGERVLWIGSGGLAHALASGFGAKHVSEQELPEGYAIFFIGSDHVVTRGQVQHLRRMSGMAVAECGKAISEAGSLIVMVDRSRTLEEDVRRCVQKVRPEEVGCMFMTGGDTALLICAALGIRSLRLLREFAPGIPLGIAEGGRFDGAPVVLKSGGFGKRDVLCRVLDMFGRKGDVPA